MEQKNMEMPQQKQYQELTFTDNFMFCKIMEKNRELCRSMLEIILGKRIKNVVFTTREQVMGITLNSKSVRLDVYVDDFEGTVYDVEMQTTKHKNLPKRARYYQGMIDLNLIEKGADYEELKRSIVIFICTFDPFDRKLPIYTFTNRCKEQLDLELRDKTVKIFVNSKGKNSNLSDDLKAFLDYLNGKVDAQNSFINQVEKEVEAARSREEWRVEYMTLMMEYREKYNEGREVGLAEQLIKSIEMNMHTYHIDLQKACEGNGVTIDEYWNAKKMIEEIDRL